MIKLYICDCAKENEHECAVKLAHHALSHSCGICAELKKDVRGKPYFDCAGVHVSLSHSNGRCAAAISDAPIGVDIEYNKSDSARALRIAKRYFTSEEHEYVKEHPEERFYEIWCKKESYIKYTGEGFSRALSSFSVLDSAMCFSLFVLDNYTLCVCSKEHTNMPPTFVNILPEVNG